MSIRDTYENDFRKLIRETLGLPLNSVHKANTEAPTGTRDQPFSTVLFTDSLATGYDNNNYASTIVPSNNVIETGQGMRRVLVSVQFFKTDAKYSGDRLKTLLHMESITAKLQQIGLGLVRTGTVRDLSQTVDTKWEERSQLDIELHLIAREDLTVPTFGRFPIGVSTEDSTINSEVFEP